MKTRIQGLTLLVFSLCVVVLFSACQKDTYVTPIIDDSPTLPYGDLPTPDWSVNPDHDYSVSMTAVVGVDLTLTYPLDPEQWQVAPGDRLGAFVGNPMTGEAECLGVATPSENADNLFFLFIVPPQGTEDITLWYYSEKLKNIFCADIAFPFMDGERQGSIDNPTIPQWTAQ